VPDLELARSFHTALDQETHLVPERVLADRNLNLSKVAHLLAINRGTSFSGTYSGMPPRVRAAD